MQSLANTIKPVRYVEWFAEKALIAEYAAECSLPIIGEINPQADIYAALENSGVMRSFAAFNNARMAGFATVLTPVLPHYGLKVASIESLFVGKSSRSGGPGRELMRTVEGYAGQAGCVGILYSAPVGSQLERLLDASKPYQRTNSIFFRRLT